MQLAPALRSLLDRPEPARKIGPFLLVHQLGRGGFAPVWLAREIYGDIEVRRVAIKLFALDAEGKRVMEEARLLCRVEHPNIVRFYSLLSDEPSGVMGLVMEYVEGSSLEKRLRARGRLPLRDALIIGSAVATALSAIHRAGLVHRDVKPANIIEATGVLKLIDFGVATAERDELLLAGTPGYIDPICVASGAQATPSSDLYALGATLFECLTGKLPSVIAAGAAGGMKGAVLSGRAPSPQLLACMPDAPPALATLVDALLAPERGRRPASAEAVAIRLERIRAERLGRAPDLPPEAVGPFRGLGRFEEADRDVYFGRSAEVAATMDLLRRRGLVALVGASGTGKSSLARAGVVPLVAGGGLGGFIPRWDTIVAEPGARPRASLAAAITSIVPDHEQARDLEPEAFAAALAASAEARGRGVLIVIDQLEELVTVADAKGAIWLADVLASIADLPTPFVRVLATARRDLLDPLLAVGRLGRVLPRSMLVVTPMSSADWVDAIDQALAAYGYSFEDAALREELKAEIVGSAAAMPLVQFALAELWGQRDRRRKIITRDGLAAIGGLSGAFERHAEATLRRALAETSLPLTTVREVLLAMTTPRGTRATRTLEELLYIGGAREIRALLERLEAARILVRQEDGLTVAHDTLLTQWWRLHDWIASAREDRLLAEEVERDAARWARETEDPSLLWKKRRLAAAEELLRLGLVKLSPLGERFIRKGRGGERRGRILVISVVSLILVVTVTLGVRYANVVAAERAASEAQLAELEVLRRAADEQQKKQCESARTLRIRGRHLLGEGKLLRAADVFYKANTLCFASSAASWPMEIEVLAELGRQERLDWLIAIIDAAPDAPAEAREARRRFGGPPPPIEKADALVSAGQAARKKGDFPGARRLFDKAIEALERAGKPKIAVEQSSGSLGEIRAVAWSRGGDRITLLHGDTVSRIDVKNGDEFSRVPLPPGGSGAAALSLDGEHVAFETGDHGVQILAAGTGTATARLPAQKATILSLGFSAKGDRLISIYNDGAVRLWSVKQTSLLAERKVDGVSAAAISPDGEMAAVGTNSGLVQISASAPPPGSDEPAPATEDTKRRVRALAFSSDSKLLASAAEDGTITLWRPGETKPLKLLEGHTRAVLAVAFSPDNKILASTSADRTVQIWNAATGKLLADRLSRVGNAGAIAFSQDGRLASGWDDRTLWLWDTAGRRVERVVGKELSGALALAFAPRGEELAAASEDHTVRLWGTAGNGRLRTLGVAAAEVTAAAFSPDGRRLVVGTRDRRVKLWGVATGEKLIALPDAADWVSAASLSPAGDRALTVEGKSKLALWDTAKGVGVKIAEESIPRQLAGMFAAEGREIIGIGEDGARRAWDTQSGALLRTLPGSAEKLVGVVISPDRSLFAAWKWHEVELRSMATGALLTKLTGPSERIEAVAFSGDGRRIASMGADRAVRLWDTGTGALLRTMTGPARTLTALSVSPTGTIVAASVDDGSILLFREESESAAATLRALAYTDAREEAKDDGAGYVMDASGHVDFMGANACAVLAKVVCKAGSMKLPFEVCEDRFYVPRLLARVVAGDGGYLEPEAESGVLQCGEGEASR